MYGLFLIVGILLAAFCGLLLCAILHRAEPEDTGVLHPFAILPVPDGKPSTRAFLHRYASQIAWMDESILRCVLLVYSPEDMETKTLCSEMAREYSFYTAMSLPDAQKLLAARAMEDRQKQPA